MLSEWFLRRTSMLDSLYVVPPPRVLARTIRRNTGAWLAERRGRRAGTAAVPDYVDAESATSCSM